MAIGTAIMDNLLPGYADALRRERVGELATGVKSGSVPLDQAYIQLAEITGRPESLEGAINRRYAGDIISSQQEGASPYDALIKFAERTGDMGLFERASKDRIKQDALSKLGGLFTSGGGVNASSLASLVTGGVLEPSSALTAYNAAQNRAHSQGGGVMGAIVRQIMQDNPNMSFTDAYGLANFGLKRGLTPTPQGGVAPTVGVTESLGQIEYGKEAGKQAAQVSAAAEKERQKKLGAGEITDIQKKATGQGQVSTLINDLQTKYKDLDKMGGIVDPEESASSNISASIRSSGVGQAVGRTVGTKEQSIRNQIQQARPLLVQAIRQATAMGARGMDSEKELEFYLNAATNPQLDIEANLDALKRLEEAYGLKANTPTGIQLDAASTDSDAVGEIKFLGFEE